MKLIVCIRIALLGVALLLSVGLSFEAAAQRCYESCDKFAGSVFSDDLVIRGASNSSEAAKKFLCSDEFVRWRRESDTQFGIGVVLEGIPVGLDLSDESSADWSKRTHFCGNSANTIANQSAYEMIHRRSTDRPEPYEEWGKCIKACVGVDEGRGDSSDISIETSTVGASTVNVVGTWHIKNPKDVLIPLYLLSENLKCTDNPFYRWSTTQVMFPCTWTGGTSGSITLTTSRGSATKSVCRKPDGYAGTLHVQYRIPVVLEEGWKQDQKRFHGLGHPNVLELNLATEPDTHYGNDVACTCSDGSGCNANNKVFTIKTRERIQCIATAREPETWTLRALRYKTVLSDDFVSDPAVTRFPSGPKSVFWNETFTILQPKGTVFRAYIDWVETGRTDFVMGEGAGSDRREVKYLRVIPDGAGGMIHEYKIVNPCRD